MRDLSNTQFVQLSAQLDRHWALGGDTIFSTKCSLLCIHSKGTIRLPLEATGLLHQDLSESIGLGTRRLGFWTIPTIIFANFYKNFYKVDKAVSILAEELTSKRCSSVGSFISLNSSVITGVLNHYHISLALEECNPQFQLSNWTTKDTVDEWTSSAQP